MSGIYKTAKRGLPLAAGFAVIAVGYSIACMLCLPATGKPESEYVMRIMFLDNSLGVDDSLGADNYLLYLPSFLYFYAAIAVADKSLLNIPSNAAGLQMLRCESMARWAAYRIRGVLIDNSVYFVGIVAGCICMPGIDLEWPLLCLLVLRFGWSLIFAFVIICGMRRANKFLAMFVSLVLSIVLMVVDRAVGDAAIISYSTDGGEMAIGCVITIVILLITAGVAGRRLRYGELLG